MRKSYDVRRQQAAKALQMSEVVLWRIACAEGLKLETALRIAEFADLPAEQIWVLKNNEARERALGAALFASAHAGRE